MAHPTSFNAAMHLADDLVKHDMEKIGTVIDQRLKLLVDNPLEMSVYVTRLQREMTRGVFEMATVLLTAMMEEPRAKVQDILLDEVTKMLKLYVEHHRKEK